jgi:hypothetical protein
MEINKKTLAKEFASFLRTYSSLVEHAESKGDERTANFYRGKAYGIQDLAMTIFGLDEMCGYWRQELIENLEEIAQG